jgi:hypothetical protein
VQPRRNGLWNRSPLAAILVVLILGASATAFAVTGSAATKDDGSATAKNSKQAFGALVTRSDSKQNTLPGALGNQPTDTGTGETKGEKSVSPTTPASNSSPVVNGGGSSNGGSLPFTGFLALGVLLTGVGLLAAGVVVRRRSVVSA